jgi:hypothetical protein
MTIHQTPRGAAPVAPGTRQDAGAGETSAVPPAGLVSPPKRKRRSKDIGTDAERAVVRYLAAHGFVHAERRALRGTKDAGDITGTPGICWEVKGGAAAKNASDLLVTDWLAETEVERHHARADLGVLILQRRAVGPANAGRWWAVLHLGHIATLTHGSDGSGIPVRMLLADAVRVLRAAGYGDPIPNGDN